MKKRIGIFGGAFNPVHKGHVQAADSFLKSGIINKLLVLPTPAPPHKNSEGLIEFSHRLEMLKRAFSNYENVTVSDLETQLPAPSYSLQTIDHLINQNPDNLYYLCLGEDSIVHFDTWYKYDEILNKVNLLVAERPGFDSDKVSENILEKTIFVDHTPVDYSSTEFRNPVKNADDSLLPKQVIDYIKEQNLYSE